MGHVNTLTNCPLVNLVGVPHCSSIVSFLQSFDKVTRQVRGAITLAIENKRSVWLATTATTCICHRPPHGALAPAQLLSPEGSQRPGMMLPSWISAKPVPANMGRWGPLPKLSLGYLALHSHLPDDLLFFKKKVLHGKELVGREGDSCAGTETTGSQGPFGLESTSRRQYGCKPCVCPGNKRWRRKLCVCQVYALKLCLLDAKQPPWNSEKAPSRNGTPS